jgi:hypothetical protein
VHYRHAAARRAGDPTTYTVMMGSMVQMIFYLMLPKQTEKALWDHDKTRINTIACAGSFSLTYYLLWMARTASENRSEAEGQPSRRRFHMQPGSSHAPKLLGRLGRSEVNRGCRIARQGAIMVHKSLPYKAGRAPSIPFPPFPLSAVAD